MTIARYFLPEVEIISFVILMAVSPAYILIQIQNYMPQYLQVLELAHISSQGHHTLCYIIINKSEVSQFSISHMDIVTSGEMRICARFKNE